MRRNYWLSGLLVMMLGIAACSPQTTDDGRVIFYQDDFSDPDSGWDVYFGEQGSAGYADEAYVITLTTENMLLWGNANLGDPIDSARIAVNVQNLNIEEQGSFGILCYYDADTLSYYYFEVATDSYRAIVKVENGVIVDYVAPDRRDEEAIPANAENYRLEVICAAGEQVLLVNGVEVARAADASLQAGDVGLFAASLTTSNVVMQFDDFLVTEVEPSRPPKTEQSP